MTVDEQRRIIAKYLLPHLDDDSSLLWSYAQSLDTLDSLLPVARKLGDVWLLEKMASNSPGYEYHAVIHAQQRVFAFAVEPVTALREALARAIVELKR